MRNLSYSNVQYANARKFLEIHFIYLGDKEVYCIFKTRSIISALFSTKCCLCHNFVFLVSNNTVFMKRAPKCKYPPGRSKVNARSRQFERLNTDIVHENEDMKVNCAVAVQRNESGAS